MRSPAEKREPAECSVHEARTVPPGPVQTKLSPHYNAGREKLNFFFAMPLRGKRRLCSRLLNEG